MFNEPLLIGEDLLEREIVALSESRRTESGFLVAYIVPRTKSW